jgi:Uma2 family endonuclease
MPFHIGDNSSPEPDVAVVFGQIRDYLADHPSEAALLVEVAESSLTYDRTVKQRLYAGAGVPEYWIVNLIDRQLFVFRDPAPDSATPGGFHYKSCQILADTDRVTPITAGASEIRVADLLP